ncbi:ribosomal protein L37AE/L43A [Evansella vedderi]|uniref:Ribosomal protein L37AE/L43A n=1 Tax=Evansella vedderi TaxID=38282 RepID=A0ABU0A0E6_9BACI|nr:nuclease-related domain-containing protein [Evansella vedderi]MDQ0256685.1 ribosomal protein L37AE/L43A [Evansella vedderi]
MIKKPRTMPLSIRKLQAILRRLPYHHPMRAKLEEDLRKRLSGQKGEASLDYILSFLPEEDYLIFHGLRLTADGKYFFQMDTLLVSPYFLLNLEAKNLRGELYFDDVIKQLVQRVDGDQKTYADPIIQVKNQVVQLNRWLRKNKFAQIPIESHVVNTNSNTHISRSPTYDECSKKVIQSSQIYEKIKQYEKIHHNEKLSKRDLRGLTSCLLKQHTPHIPDLLTKYNIQKEELKKGVHCPKCQAIPMIRSKGIWTCSNHQCHFESKITHIEAIKDYALIYGRTITVKQLRAFLNIKSRYTANRIIKSLNFPFEGKNKWRVYTIPFAFLDP